MNLSLSTEDLSLYVQRQIQTFFPDGYQFDFRDPVYAAAFDAALERTEECFKHVTLRGYAKDGDACFNHMHSDQYTQFLCYLMSSLWLEAEDAALASRVMNLSRALSGMFISFKCQLPDHFVLGHPVGTVLGNASYGDCLVVFQNVTVNTGDDAHQEKGPTPVLGKGLFLGAGAKIIGTQPVGNRVSVGVDAAVVNQNIPDDSVVINVKGEQLIRSRKSAECHAQTYFDIRL